MELDLFSLPSRLSGLGICNLAKVARLLYEGAVDVTKPMVDPILKLDDENEDLHHRSFGSTLADQREAIKRKNHTWNANKGETARSLRDSLPPE